MFMAVFCVLCVGATGRIIVLCDKRIIVIVELLFESESANILRTIRWQSEFILSDRRNQLRNNITDVCELSENSIGVTVVNVAEHKNPQLQVFSVDLKTFAVMDLYGAIVLNDDFDGHTIFDGKNIKVKRMHF